MRRHKTVSEAMHREQLTPQRLPYALPGTQGVRYRAKHTVAASYPDCRHVVSIRKTVSARASVFPR